MFQTELNVFLQSLGNGVTDAAMLGVSLFGYSAFYLLALCVILFGVDFRRGFVLLQVVLWTGAATMILKELIGLPRPYHADSRVLDVTRDRAVRTELFAMGGQRFFDLPQEAAIRYVRGLGAPNYGMPSGHASGFTAFVGGLAQLWDWRRGGIAALLAALLMAFSRVYLGRHFLADVLVGLALGAIALALLWNWLRSATAAPRLPRTDGFSPSGPATLGLLVSPWLLLACPVSADAAGLLLGLNVGFWVVGRGGYPIDDASRARRTARAVLAVLLTALGALAAREIGDALGVFGEPDPVAFALGTIPGFALIWGTTTACLRLGLYAGRRPPGAAVTSA